MISIPRLPVLYMMYLAIHLQNTANCSTVTKYAHMGGIPTVAHSEEDYPMGEFPLVAYPVGTTLPFHRRSINGELPYQRLP